jgi:hypothetical protein
MKGII